MKTMIDRSHALFATVNKFKDIYLIAFAAENDESIIDGTIYSSQGWLDCHNRIILKDVIKGVGVDNVGVIEGKPVLKEVYLLGKSIS